jgi:hypothetical protein
LNPNGVTNMLRERLPRSARIALLLAAGLLAACDRPEASAVLWAESDVRGDRVPIRGDFEEQWVTGGGVNDTLLQLPRFVRADSGLVLVYDDGGNRLLGLSAVTGALRWSFGQQGQGPDEFMNVRDARFDMTGRIVVYDVGNARITVLDRSGRALRRVALRRVDDADQIVPLSEGRFLLVTHAQEKPVVVLDSGGSVVSRGDLPWPGFAALSFLARQGAIASEGDHWVYAFSLGNGFFSYLADRPIGTIGRYVEHQPFPVPVTSVRQDGSTTHTSTAISITNCSACSVSMSDSVLYVHFGGLGAQRNRVLDLYDWDTSDYIGSITLPWAPRDLVVHGERFYALRNQPAPHIIAGTLTWSEEWPEIAEHPEI